MQIAELVPPSVVPFINRGIRAGSHRDGPRAVVPRLATVPGAVWRPSRWLLGLPALADQEDFLAWLRWASPGVEISYFCGESLAEARREDGTLDGLARLLLCHADQRWNVSTPPPCGHIRGLVIGGANVTLLQRRVGGRNFLHLARRR